MHKTTIGEENMKKAQYEVIVGNIGTVYSGTDKAEADRQFDTYVQASQAGCGRAGDEPVTMMKDGDIYQEWEV
jgi:hypothetical protein